ncbi:hypothetical protein [Saccharothrix deserti]|uniref:hypothetical protein n=1 Tax=Saccharothrix deserti TaxID=2593674 RepID=UPI001EE4AF0F|nr:hypothetical protein [Saccharothrix deserti]
MAATARNGAGLTFGLTASADVSDLGAAPVGQSAVTLGPFRLVPLVVEPVTFEEVARLVHLGRAVAARHRVAGTVAA